MKWSPQQDAALKAVSAWLKDRNGQPVFKLFGYAGTGKTSLATHLAESVKKVNFAAFTGKAALVMRSRGCHGANTIHSLIYRPDEDESHGDNAAFKLNPLSPIRNSNLVIIDECSMVGEELARDLMSFGVKILVLGDSGQLPPVSGETGYFNSGKPDIMLTEIHRQAADNPIIRMSIDIREGRGLQYGQYGDSKVIKRSDVDQREVMAADQIIVGMNKTRINFNTRVRELKGRKSDNPERDDKIVCLKNNKEKQLLNGQLWTVETADVKKTGRAHMLVTPEDGGDARKVTTHIDFFTGKDADMPYSAKKNFDQFTYGYALTCHKSQGSSWPNVYLFDESTSFRDNRKEWVYTAITRASERITVVK